MSERVVPEFRRKLALNARNGLDFSKHPSLTCQEDKDGCDINKILERYAQTGVLPGARGTPVYDDFSESVDYQSALEIVSQAEEQFMSLGAKVRQEFGNDPAKFLSFVADPKNAQRCRELGLFREESILGIPPVVEPSKASGGKSDGVSAPPSQPVSDSVRK